MQAVFRFRGAEEIVVSDQANGVMVEFYAGYEGNQCDHCAAQGPGALCGKCPPGPGLTKKHIASFSKSEARSIASAIMGAAAQL